MRMPNRMPAHGSQSGSTSDLIFGVKKTVSLLSRGVTLMPGDVIFTGT